MLKVITSESSAWRAAYFYWNDKKLGYLGIDPYDKYNMIGPRVFGGVGDRVFYYSLPYMKWRSNMGEMAGKFYQKQNSFWIKMDGRR